MNARAMGLIAKGVLVESTRRRELYVIVLMACLLIGFVMTLDFFGLEGLTKFHREVALKVMGVSTALAVIVLAARQLPREIENRTIYPLLARPISRLDFLLGKLLGVLLAGMFCFGLFMAVYVGGALRLGVEVPWGLFLQHIYLQLILILVIASLSFLLSMLLNLDAAIAIGVIFLLVSSTYSSILVYLYEFAGGIGQRCLLALNYAIPQIVLFDLSEKAVHADVWAPLPLHVLAALSGYGLAFVGLYLALTVLLFRRKAL